MDYQDFQRLLGQMASQDFQDNLAKVNDLETLVNTMSSLSQEEKDNLLKKLNLFAACDVKDESFDQDGLYEPKLSKLDFVHCDFTGVGYEWDGGHYGVVWEVNPKFDAITIIPTTSQRRQEYPNVISVGRRLGLPYGNTTLLVSDMTKVSRKRLNPVTFDHYTRGKTRTRLQTSWIPRIQEAVAVTYANEITFMELLKNSAGVSMPKDLQAFYDWSFKPVKARYDYKNHRYFVRLWNQDTWHIIEMTNPNRQMARSEKKNLINKLMSSDHGVKDRAKQRFHSLYVDI